MANTLDDIERLIRARGWQVERLPDADVLSAYLPTKAYKNAAGRSQLEVRIHVDAERQCLVMLVRPHYDPQAGEVRLRVDGLLEGDLEAGMSPGNVVTMLEALPAFADSVYPQLSSGMASESVEPFPQLMPAHDPSREQRLADIARRAGGVNRLAAPLRMKQRRLNDGGGSGPSLN